MYKCSSLVQILKQFLPITTYMSSGNPNGNSGICTYFSKICVQILLLPFGFQYMLRVKIGLILVHLALLQSYVNLRLNETKKAPRIKVKKIMSETKKKHLKHPNKQTFHHTLFSVQAKNRWTKKC